MVTNKIVYNVMKLEDNIQVKFCVISVIIRCCKI